MVIHDHQWTIYLCILFPVLFLGINWFVYTIQQANAHPLITDFTAGVEIRSDASQSFPSGHHKTIATRYGWASLTRRSYKSLHYSCFPCVPWSQSRKVMRNEESITCIFKSTWFDLGPRSCPLLSLCCLTHLTRAQRPNTLGLLCPPNSTHPLALSDQLGSKYGEIQSRYSASSPFLRWSRSHLSVLEYAQAPPLLLLLGNTHFDEEEKEAAPWSSFSWLVTITVAHPHFTSFLLVFVFPPPSERPHADVVQFAPPPYDDV